MLSILLAWCNLSTSCNKSVKSRLVATCHLQSCYNLLKQFVITRHNKCYFVWLFHSFSKTRVALIMSDYIPGCDIVTNFIKLQQACWTNHLATSLLTTCNKLVNNLQQTCGHNWSQAMQTHPDIL